LGGADRGLPAGGRHPDRVRRWPPPAYVETSEPLWRDVREIILCTYDDDAGNALREDVATAFGRSRCKWVRYPKGCHDLNEALRQFGVRGVQETIRRAPWLAVPDIYAMSELPEAA
jgi:twinkle protein